MRCPRAFLPNQCPWANSFTLSLQSSLAMLSYPHPNTCIGIVSKRQLRVNHHQEEEEEDDTMPTDIMSCPVLDDKNTPNQRPQSNSDTPPATPTAMSSAAHYLICEIQDIHTTLKELSSLAPSPIVNTLLSRLVELCIQPFSEDLARDILSMPEIEKLCLSLRPLCATAEGELERYWTQRMLESSNSLIGIVDAFRPPFSVPADSARFKFRYNIHFKLRFTIT